MKFPNFCMKRFASIDKHILVGKDLDDGAGDDNDDVMFPYISHDFVLKFKNQS